MASEVTVQSYMQLKKGFLEYQARPNAFTADMEGTVGPTPGAVLVSKYGTSIDLSQILVPGGLCRIMNLDADNYVEWGTYDLDAPRGTFYPVGELLPGESFVLRLSRQLGVQQGTGSGTAFSDSGLALRMKAVGGSCVVLVEAFDA